MAEFWVFRAPPRRPSYPDYPATACTCGRRSSDSQCAGLQPACIADVPTSRWAASATQKQRLLLSCGNGCFGSRAGVAWIRGNARPPLHTSKRRGSTQ